MARSNFRIEHGLEILAENGGAGPVIIKGAGAPAGVSGQTDDAPIGSLYLRTDGEGEIYHKLADTSSASDWEPLADSSVYTALGIPFDDEDMGAYTGSILTDNQDAKSNIQELSDAIEAISGGATSEATAVTTEVVLDSCDVNACMAAEWEVLGVDEDAEGNREFVKLTAMHNGDLDGTTDASSVDLSAHTKLKLGVDNGFTFNVALSGTGASQVMELRVAASTASTFKARRTDIV